MRHTITRISASLVSWLFVCVLLSLFLDSTLEEVARGQVEDLVNARLMEMKPKDFAGRSPAEVREDLRAGPAVRALKEYLGIGLPKAVRVARRALSMAVLDLDGTMWARDREILRYVTRIKDRVFGALGPTLAMFAASTLMAFVIGLPLGAAAAYRPGSFIDRTVRMLAAVIYGVPTWWLGAFIVFYVGIEWRLLPFGRLHSASLPEGFFAAALDYAKYLAMPVVSIAFIRLWGFAFLTRAILSGTMHEDYSMAARARGIPERRVGLGHALDSALPAIVTQGGMVIVHSLSGDAVVELVFARPGIGALLIGAIQQNDVPVAAGVLSVLTATVIVVLTALDLAYGLMDPRIASSRRVAADRRPFGLPARGRPKGRRRADD